MKIYKKNKRKNQDFIAYDVIQELDLRTDYDVEIAKRIQKDGKEATTEGLHTYIHEYFRKQWYERLVELGWDEDRAFNWVYKKIMSTPDERAERLGE